MKILVITSCTSRKKYKTASQLQPEDFISTGRLEARSAELKSYEKSATDMYTGQQHLHLKAGLEQLRTYYKEAVVNLHIISAGYGLLNESDNIVPYNATFKGLKPTELLTRSNSLQLHERVETLIAKYDLVLFLLGAEYVRALQLPFEVPDTVTQIFMIGTGSRKLIPDLPNTHFVPTGESLRRNLQTTFTTLKGLVFERLCAYVCCEGLQVFEEIRRNPQRILDVVLT